MYKFALNICQSPLDERDFDVDTHLSTIEIKKGKIIKNILPTSLSYKNLLQPVRNQGRQGSCAAMAASAMKEWQEKVDYNLDEYMSPQFFYNNRYNLYDSNKKNDSGMYLRDVMKMLKTIGICYEKTYPYGRIEHKNKIEKHVYEEAKKHVIKTYAKINTVEDLKKSLFVNGPCIVAVPVWNYGKRMWKRREEKDKKLLGGHAMCVIGYDRTGFIIRNSWGKTWNGSGYTKMPYEDFKLAWEFWTTIDADTILDDPEPEPEPEPKPEPEPEPEPEEEFTFTNMEVKFSKDKDGLIYGTFKQFHM